MGAVYEAAQHLTRVAPVLANRYRSWRSSLETLHRRVSCPCGPTVVTIRSVPATEAEEAQEEARRRKGDGDAEDDLDQPTETAAGIAEGQRQPGDDDDDHRDNLGDRAFDRLQDRLQRRFLGHRRAGGVGGGHRE